MLFCAYMRWFETMTTIKTQIRPLTLLCWLILQIESLGEQVADQRRLLSETERRLAEKRATLSATEDDLAARGNQVRSQCFEALLGCQGWL